MQINLHQTHHEIGDFESVFKYLTSFFQDKMAFGIHVFPELFLTGYPLQDLVLKKTFIEEYQALIEDLTLWAKTQFQKNQDILILFGGLDYELDEERRAKLIKNVVYQIDSHGLKIAATKQLLPNYDLFEEKKYFTAGNESTVIEFNNKKIALLVCEDMWFSHLHPVDPVLKLKAKNEFLDLIINLSASPFNIYKKDQRYDRARQISKFLNAPLAYVNRVGAEDEILFDGGSFVSNGDKIIKKAGFFKSEVLTCELPEFQAISTPDNYEKNKSSWSDIMSHRIDLNSLKLHPLNKDELEQILNALTFGVYDYAEKTKNHRFSLALSGGIDSSLVLTILKLLKDKYQKINGKEIEIEAVYMPGLYSSTLSYDLSYDLCRKLKIKLTTLPIKFIQSTIKNNFREHFHAELVGVPDENLQSRIRGLLIYTRSNQSNSLILNTSNKSEIAVGYSTQYGDSVGALSILGDLYKTEVFQLSNYINEVYGELIPKEIITRPPTAELKENQTDNQSLPEYDVLDPILDGLLSFNYSVNDLIKLGFNNQDVLKVSKLFSNSEYKRKQFCPIIKLKPKSFGFGHRVPICKKQF